MALTIEDGMPRGPRGGIKRHDNYKYKSDGLQRIDMVVCFDRPADGDMCFIPDTPWLFVTRDGAVLRNGATPLLARKRGKYLRVRTMVDGKYKELNVHRLVARAFCVGHFDGAVVNHINGDCLDNNASNLEWCTPSQNARHAIATGLKPRRLSSGDLDQVMDRYSSGETLAGIAASLGVSETAIRNAVHGRTYAFETRSKPAVRGRRRKSVNGA